MLLSSVEEHERTLTLEPWAACSSLGARVGIGTGDCGLRAHCRIGTLLVMADNDETPQAAVPLRILVACEYSGRVREAFRKLGHDAWSCDLLPSDDNSPYHIQGDVLEHLNDGWDIMIAHPPCTHLAVSGARWFKDKQTEQAEALEFVQKLLDAPIPKIALENPISIISSKIRKPNQIIQPWQFGHGETKATCLWLKNLPELQPTDIVSGREHKVWRMPPSEERWKLRSITYQGIANAMANQWGLI
jgi:site-specific DNA-cytosine methylase